MGRKVSNQTNTCRGSYINLNQSSCQKLQWRFENNLKQIVLVECSNYSDPSKRNLADRVGVDGVMLLIIYSKTCLKWPLKKQTKIWLKTDYRLMQAKSIEECSKRAFGNTFDLH